MKVLINSLIATSTLNQAKLIKKLIEEKGYEAEFKNLITLSDVKSDSVYAILWFQLATVTFLSDVVVPYLFANKPKAIYVTIEGIPAKSAILCSNIPRLEFIANSKFTADCLKKSGLKVIDVVHHAIDFNEVKKAKKLSSMIRRKWKDEYKDKVIFLYVGRHDPRKALNKLSGAVDILNEKGIKDWVLLLHTEKKASSLFNKENCKIIGQFGTKSYIETLAMMGAADYVIFPSVCEGFGLPVLEANAMGTPVLHCWMPPLLEFSSEEFNFVWEYVDRRLVNQGNAQYWIFHEYPEWIISQVMEDAIKVRKESNQEYMEYREKAYKHARKWNYKHVYMRLLKHLNIM